MFAPVFRKDVDGIQVPKTKEHGDSLPAGKSSAQS
jgi:hypothetical protein